MQSMGPIIEKNHIGAAFKYTVPMQRMGTRISEEHRKWTAGNSSNK